MLDYHQSTVEAISALPTEKAIDLVKFYEESASVVKTRTWTITTWVLTLNSGLLAFAFQLYTDHRDVPGFLLLELAITIVGVALCLFLAVLIRDQGNHLQHYWTAENQVGAWNASVRALVVTPEEYSKVQSVDYRAPFPRFCKRLLALAGLFLGGFVGHFLLMAYLQ